MRSPLVPTFLLLLTAALGCASTPVSAPTSATAVRPDDDVDVLRERVARLERRLADVDAKLGLLLAQRATRTPRRPMGIASDQVSNDERVTRDLGPRELIIEEPPRDEASLGASAGLRSIDLGPSASSAMQEQEDVPDAPVDHGGDAVVIRMSGDGPPSVGVGLPETANVAQLYAWAHERVKARALVEAITAFEEIEKRNPTHELADNCAYWIGWAHQERGDHRLALQVWERLPLRYPKSAKVPDALFGMAVSHEALGEPAVAETLYEAVVRRFPKAEKVRDANRALARLRPR